MYIGSNVDPNNGSPVELDYRLLPLAVWLFFALCFALHPDSPLDVHGYAAGSAGPAESDQLLAQDGRTWRALTDTRKKD